MATAISTAIGTERKSRANGQRVLRGQFDNTTTNLPQMVAVFGEANTANQAGLSTDKRIITSAQQAGELYGFGSPIHQMIRILRPQSGTGIGGIPTVVFPQISDGSATATTITITVTGTANANATHNIVINGRSGLDGLNYSVAVVNGDDNEAIATKIAASVNAVLNSPVTATASTNTVVFTSKWEGATSDDINISFNTNDNTAGLTYAQTDKTSGAGSVSLADSLSQFQEDWYTIVINSYGASQFEALEQFNGIPDVTNPTGRYSGLNFRPFVAMFGSTESTTADLLAITDASARRTQVTNALCAAPNSSGMPFEAAANMARLFARTVQDRPQSDVNAQSYPDMPVPQNEVIGDMANYENRDLLVKGGCSTVTLRDGVYQIQDFVTTYHPTGEGNFRLVYDFVRNINVVWNVVFGYRALEERFVQDHVLIDNNQVVEIPNAVSPNEWRAIIFSYIDALVIRGLINNAEFSQGSVRVQISDQNPDRIETTFNIILTGIGRILSTDLQVGF